MYKYKQFCKFVSRQILYILYIKYYKTPQPAFRILVLKEHLKLHNFFIYLNARLSGMQINTNK